MLGEMSDRLNIPTNIAGIAQAFFNVVNTRTTRASIYEKGVRKKKIRNFI